jgi:hypothetical protein
MKKTLSYFDLVPKILIIFIILNVAYLLNSQAAGYFTQMLPLRVIKHSDEFSFTQLITLFCDSSSNLQKMWRNKQHPVGVR